MTRYFFVLEGLGDTHDDRVGTLLPDDGAAEAYARRIIRELKEAGGYDDPRLAMIVLSELRQALFTIPFSNEVVEANNDPKPKPSVEPD